jgi:hypothetical protein
MMVACLMLVLLYFAVPYPAYQAVRYWTGSPAASWVGAIVAVPAGVLLYVRLFERLKHGARHKGGRPLCGCSRNDSESTHDETPFDRSHAGSPLAALGS